MLDRLRPEFDVRINSGISDLSQDALSSNWRNHFQNLLLSNERPRKSKHAYSQNLTTGMAIIVRLILPRILPQGFKILQIPISPEKMEKEYVFNSMRAHMTDSILLPRPSKVNSSLISWTIALSSLQSATARVKCVVSHWHSNTWRILSVSSTTTYSLAANGRTLSDASAPCPNHFPLTPTAFVVLFVHTVLDYSVGSKYYWVCCYRYLHCVRASA